MTNLQNESFEIKLDIFSVMHYGEFAFRNKEWAGLVSEFTRTIYPNPLSVQALQVRAAANISQLFEELSWGYG